MNSATEQSEQVIQLNLRNATKTHEVLEQKQLHISTELYLQRSFSSPVLLSVVDLEGLKRFTGC
jgi:hypothetical protein